MTSSLLACLRHVAAPSLPWALVGIMAGGTWALVDIAATMDHYSQAMRLYRAFMPGLLVAMILIAAVAIGIGQGTVTQAMQRKGRLLLALLAGSLFGVLAIWLVNLTAPTAAIFSTEVRLMSWWLTILVYGGAFGYAAILNIQRVEDQTQLAAVLARRSLLARQVAQARLMQARANIEPDMVTRVLKVMRERYRTDPESAASLLDQLIGYLRMAMQRERGGKSELERELAQLRAYAVLREAESGLRIRLDLDATGADGTQTDTSSMATVPVFAAAKLVLDALGGMQAITLRLEAGTRIVLDTGTCALPAATLAQLRTRLHALHCAAGALDILHRPQDSGVHQYVVFPNSQHASDRHPG